MKQIYLLTLVIALLFSACKKDGGTLSADSIKGRWILKEELLSDGSVTNYRDTVGAAKLVITDTVFNLITYRLFKYTSRYTVQPANITIRSTNIPYQLIFKDDPLSQDNPYFNVTSDKLTLYYRQGTAYSYVEIYERRD